MNAQAIGNVSQEAVRISKLYHKLVRQEFLSKKKSERRIQNIKMSEFLITEKQPKGLAHYK